MAESGGAAATEGILYQAAVTTVWLTRMLNGEDDIAAVRPETPFVKPEEAMAPLRAYVDDIRIDRASNPSTYCQVKISPGFGNWTWSAMSRQRDRGGRPRNVWRSFFQHHLRHPADRLEFWTSRGAETITRLCDKAYDYKRLDEFLAQLTGPQQRTMAELVENLTTSDGTQAGEDAVWRFLKNVHVVQETREAVDEVARSNLKRYGGANADSKAWNALFEEALAASARRRELDRGEVVVILANHDVHALDPVATAADYISWLATTTGTLRVPGVGKHLPIEEAWVRLRVLGADSTQRTRAPSIAAEVKAYHDWESLASNVEGTYEASDTAELGLRVVVVGGPGSGKSTLVKLAAHRLATRGHRVLRVRLSELAARVGQGEAFDSALCTAATGNFGVAGSSLRSALAQPDAILADGLDECGVRRAEIAERLHAWSLAHPTTRVVVTSRPIAYDYGFFPEWVHATILPLTADGVERHARNLLELLGTHPDRRRQLTEFLEQLDRAPVASLASRNPLLLTFLVQLALAGVSLQGTRARLYEKLVELWIHREQSHESSGMEPTEAHQALDWIGWIILTLPDGEVGLSRQDLFRRLAAAGARELQIGRGDAQSHARNAIRFWEEQGLLEHLDVSGEDAYTFVHASIGEFAAARYLAQQPAAERWHMLQSIRGNPRWTETVLILAGLVDTDDLVGRLLDAEDPSDPSAVESLVAYAALAEREPSDEHVDLLVRRATESVIRRLSSNIPSTVFEATRALLPLARVRSRALGDAVRSLLGHAQSWTRLAALRLELETADPDLDVVEQFIDSLEVIQMHVQIGGVREGRGPSWPKAEVPALDEEVMQADVVREALPLLARMRPGEATLARIRRVARENVAGRMASATAKDLLSSLGYDDEIERPPPLLDTSWWISADRAADRAFLDAVDRVTSDKSVAVEPAGQSVLLAIDLATLGAVLDALSPGHHLAGDWSHLVDGSRHHVIDTVVSGAIAAVAAEPRKLRSEAALARQLMDESQTSTLGVLLPKFPIRQPDWSRASSQNYVPEDLVSALSHPCLGVQDAAVHLVAQGAGGTASKDLAKRILVHGPDEALRSIAALSIVLWGSSECIEPLAGRLTNGSLSPGCKWLIRAFQHIPSARGDERVRLSLLRCLEAPDPELAMEAVETVRHFGRAYARGVLYGLTASYRRWSRRGSYCEKCATSTLQQHCETCGKTLISPIPNLVTILGDLGALDLATLLGLCDDKRYDVANAALEQVTKAAHADIELARELLLDMNTGKRPAYLIEAVLTAPVELLISLRPHLDICMATASREVRIRMLESLPEAGWISREDAEASAFTRLADPDSKVREQAVRTLRLLRHDPTQLS